MFRINEQLEAAIYVNGKELMLNGVNFLQSIHINTAATSQLPVAVIRFVDLIDSASDVGLQDNVPLVLTLAGAVTVDRKLRVYSWRRSPAGEGFSYEVTCYWDAPKFWSATSNKVYQGTTYEVMQTIASECGLQFGKNNTATSDPMQWSQGNRTFGEFARHLARHGYANDKSHMVLGVDSTGVLRYLDLNGIPKPEINLGYISEATSGPFIQITGFQPTNVAGTNNTVAGYLHDRHIQLLEEPAVLKSVTLDPDSRKPLLNLEVRDMIGRGGISYGPIDFGNVHPKYERARYQNQRFNLLNNLVAEFVVGFQTTLEMFDNFKYVPPRQLGSEAYSGEYTIASKIIYIPGNAYYEKLIAVKNGLET